MLRLSKSFSKVVLIAGTPSHDLAGARLMQAISKVRPDSTFVGIGGKHMAAAKLLPLEGLTVDMFMDKPWINYEKFNHVTTESPASFISMPIIRRNKKVLEGLKAVSSLNQIHTADAFVVLGNEIFVKRFGELVSAEFEALKRVRPPTFFWNMRYDNFRIDEEQVIDHIFASIPKRPHNYQYYGFPATVVGYPGVTKALDKFVGLEDHGLEVFKQRLEQAIVQERKAGRQAMSIPDDKYVITLAPGSNLKEAQFSARQFTKMMKQYLGQKERLTKESFVCLVPLPTETDPTQATAMRNKLQSLSAQVSVRFVNEDKLHQAMACSDFGVIYNGEMVAEAAACHLPSLVIENMSFYKAYFQNLFNMRVSALNLAKSKTGFLELKCESECAAPRLAEILEEHIKTPKLYHFYTKLYDPVLYEMRPRRQGKFVDGVQLAAQSLVYAQEAVKASQYSGREDVDSRRVIMPKIKESRGMYSKA